MQLNQSASYEGEELAGDTPVQSKRLQILDRDIIEGAAQALFEFVFSSCERLDGKHHWNDCDENIKKGFRGEATAVIEAAWLLLFRKLR